MYVNEGTMACSWDKDIFTERGQFLAEDAFYNGTSLTMAPGADIHRTPLSGRNHEYYSEDPNLSYLLGAVQCKAMQDNGTVCQLKHFCGNDTETNRSGCNEFMQEQTLREVCLRGFEGAMVIGGANSIMTGVNCLGVCKNPRNYNLLTGVLRDEWDWKGIVNTDAKDCTDTPALCVVSGVDEFCLTNDINREISKASNNDDHLVDAMIKSNKRFYYTYISSNLMNGLSSSTSVRNVSSWWKTAFIVIDSVAVALFACSIAVYAYLLISKKEELKFGGKSK